MSKKIENSFTQNVIDLTKNVNMALASMEAMNESLTTENDTVNIEVEGTDPVTGDPSTYTYAIPSYPYILSQLNRITNSVDTFFSFN